MPGIRAARVRLIGLTGAAGSGKSTVAKVFARLGAGVIDADRLGHRLLGRNSPCFARLVKAFGPEILTASGGISRSRLGGLVFSDRRKLERLNRIIHPSLTREIRRQALALLRKEPSRPVVIDAALIVSWGMDAELDLLITVEATKEARLARLMRRGLSQKRARMIFDSQPNPAILRKRAGLVIENHGTVRELERKAAREWRRLGGASGSAGV
jgi:dephospho-CoA kinase